VADNFDSDLMMRMAYILSDLGADLEGESMRRTPERWVQAMRELTKGYVVTDHILQKMLTTFPAEGADQMIVQHNIPVYSLCEHHILPFAGYAHIGYIPKDRIIGLSKFKRCVDVFARRFQVQERLTRQICNALQEHLDPRGVIVVVEAEHFCMTMKRNSDTRHANHDQCSDG